MSAFQKYFVSTLKDRYADFSGRASRSEYWYFALFYLLILIPVAALIFIGMDMTSITSAEPSMSMIGKIGLGLLGVAILAMIIPSLAVTIRRLHDIGRSGWWYLIAFIPFGTLVLFVFSLLESQPGRNKWGPNPWEVVSDGDEISQHLIEDYSA